MCGELQSISFSHSSKESGQDSHSHGMAQAFRPGNALNQASSPQCPELLPEVLLFFFALLMYCPAARSGAPRVCQKSSGCDAAAAPSCGSWGTRAPQSSPISSHTHPLLREPDAFIFNTIEGREEWQFEGKRTTSSISVAQ